MFNKRRYIAKRRSPSFAFNLRYRLMVHEIDHDGQPICGAQIRAERWSELEEGDFMKDELCRRCATISEFL